MKKIASSIMIVLLWISMFSIFAPKVNAEETVIFQDDFESYAVGSFPSSGGWEIVWNGAGDEQQIITNAQSYTGAKSFSLLGVYGWSCVVQKKFSSSAPIIGYELSILIEAEVTFHVANPGFHKLGGEGNYWGAYYAVTGFSLDGKIHGEDGTDLGSWAPQTWYRIRTVLDRTSKTCSTWINGVLKGQNMPLCYSQPEIIDSLALTSTWAGVRVYYDDVKVFEVSATPPPETAWDSTLYLDSGSGTFASVSAANPTIYVPPGQLLSGTVTLIANNNIPPNCVVPLIGTPSWGEHSTSWWLIHSWLPYGSSIQTTNVQLYAPSQAGIYYIIFAFRGELTGEQMASATNWPLGYVVWNDGNDIADFSSTQIGEAQQNGVTVVNWLYTEGYKPTYTPACAITVVVGGTPPSGGLVGYWKLDEGYGSTATDSSGNDNTGILNNGPVWVDGRFGKALSFDGVDDYVRIEPSLSLDVTSQITVEAWVYPRAYVDSNGDNSHIISRCAINGGAIYVLQTYSPTSTKAGYAVNQIPWHHASSADLPLNTWTHLAMTYDGATVKLYINGEFDSSYAQSGPIEVTSNWLAFGCKPTGPWGGAGTYAYFNGIIDEVRIYSRALSQQEIQTDMGEISPPTEHDFNLRWSSPFYGVTAGQDTFFVIHLDYSEGFDEIVTLSVQNLPEGCTAWFDIDTLRPPVSYRTLHVSTHSTLNNGTYVFLVKGETSDSYQVIPVTLTVGTGKITGVVYRDDNGNGIRDLGEPIVSGATLGYYATRNYRNLYVAGATSNAEGEFTLVNVPFNVLNEITATAAGLTQRCISINIMNQLETQIDIGIKPPTIIYKPVIIDGCKYQLKLLYGADGQVTNGFILNLTSSEQPSYVNPSDPANDNYAMGITKRVIRAMLIQELASELININALPYQQIFRQSPELESWLVEASSDWKWYALMPLTGFSITPDTQIQWKDRLRSVIFDSIDDHTESLLNLHEWEETPGCDNAVAAKDALLELPGFESPSNDVEFWNYLSEYYVNARKYYNLLVLKKLTESELSYMDNIISQSDVAGVSNDVKEALWYCRVVRSDYAWSLVNNIGQYAFEIIWDELLDPGDLVTGAIEGGIKANVLPIGLTSLISILLQVKIATIFLLSPQETYDNIRDAEAGRVVLRNLEKIHQSYITMLQSETEISEDLTETIAMLMNMEYRVGENTANIAKSALGCSIVGKAMDLIDPSWRSTMSFFEAKEKWAKEYAKFINKRLKDDVNKIANKITVPSDAFSFVLHSPANLYVIDPQGRSIGFDPQTSAVVNEIPTAVYTGPNSEPEIISIASPLNGAYRILLAGTNTGTYNLDITLITPTQTTTETFSGYIELDQIKVHHVFVPESGETIILDDTPPTTKLTIGEPKYTATDITYVTSDTLFTLTSTDGEGSGVSSTAYRIFNDTYDTGWITYLAPFNLNSLNDGTYTIAFNSIDNAGNVEQTNTIQVTLFSWTYIFTDSYGRGNTLKINTEHKLFQFATPNKDFGIKHDPKMIQLKNVIIICFEDKEMMLIATAVDDKIDFCSAIALDKQTRKTYILIDKPNWPKYCRERFTI